MSWPNLQLQDMTEPERSITYGVVKPGPEDPDQGVLFVRGGDIKEGKIAVQNLRTITDNVSKPYSRTILRGGEILISLVGNPGEAAIAPTELAGANIARQAGLVALRPEFNSKFVMYFLRSPKGRSELFQRTKGAVQQVINLADLKTVNVPQPDLPTQERIASILAAYDDLIENNRRRIALLEQAARLLYREWFVHFRFPGHETATFVDGLPKGWERKKLGEVCSTNKNSHKKGKLPKTVRYVDIGSVSTGHIDEVTEYDPEDAPGRARRIAEPMDTIWSNVRPNLKAYALVMSPRENDVFSTGFTVLHAEDVSPFFLYFTVTTEDFVRHLMNHATGASYPAVRSDDFERAGVIVPPSSLMDDFHAYAEPAFEQRQKLSDQTVELAKARNLILPRLMDGRIPV